MSAELDDNIIFGTSKPTLVEDTANGRSPVRTTG